MLCFQGGAQKMKCPKCNSEMIKGNTNTGTTRVPMSVTNDDPMKMFGGEKRSNVSVYICMGCGYIELYADNYKELLS